MKNHFMYNESEFNVPLHCGSCGYELEWSDTGVDLLCKNIECPAQLLNRIEYFLKTLGIEELSGTTLEKFNLSSLEDVFTLTGDYIQSLDGFQEKRASIIIEQIRKCITNVDPALLLAAFGIPGLGKKNAEKILRLIDEKNGKTIFELFFKLEKIHLLSINGIGSKLAEQILSQKQYIKNTLNMLYKHSLTFKNINECSKYLQGKNITVTGTSPNKITRQQIEQFIIDNGGNNTGISKKTDYLVAENVNGTSSKLKKARELNIKIITYETFFDIIHIV